MMAVNEDRTIPSTAGTIDQTEMTEMTETTDRTGTAVAVSNLMTLLWPTAVSGEEIDNLIHDLIAGSARGIREAIHTVTGTNSQESHVDPVTTESIPREQLQTTESKQNTMDKMDETPGTFVESEDRMISQLVDLDVMNNVNIHVISSEKFETNNNRIHRDGARS